MLSWAYKRAMLLLLAILFAVVFCVCAFLYSRNATMPTLIGMVACGLLTLTCAGLDSVKKVSGDTSAIKADRKVAEARHVVQAEYLAKTIGADLSRAVFLKDETSPVSAFVEEGLREGFGSQTEFSTFTGDSENFDFGATEESFRFTPRMVTKAARGLGGKGVLIFSEPPGPLTLRVLGQRKPGTKVAILNVDDEARASAMAKRNRIDYVVYSKPFAERLSDQNGKFSGNLQKAFDGDFVLHSK